VTSTSFKPSRLSGRGAAGDTRERILWSAAELFAERGYDAASIREICARARVTRPSLYWHFGNKQGLLSAVIDHVGRTWIEEVRAYALTRNRPEERLDAFLESWRVLIEKHSDLLRVYLSVALQPGSVPEEVVESVRRSRAEILAAMSDGVERSLGDQVPEADVLIALCLAQIHGVLLHYMLDPGSLDLDRVWRQLRRTLVLSVADRIADRRGGRS
jgi:AcrR family transcriptional regulator